jgi:hypothetical protein
MIWLYPGQDVPITSQNIMKALDAASEVAQGGKTPRIRYFSSVPYVLQLLEEETDGLDGLRKMDVVGVGGAALPDEVGNRLVDKGINLVSSFGSSECGFLISDALIFGNERPYPGVLLFRSEECIHATSLRVVKQMWPIIEQLNSKSQDHARIGRDMVKPMP